MGTHGLMHGIEALSLAGRQGKAMSCVGWIGVSCRSTLPSWTSISVRLSSRKARPLAVNYRTSTAVLTPMACSSW